jgi:hypothetical protein
MHADAGGSCSCLFQICPATVAAWEAAAARQLQGRAQRLHLHSPVQEGAGHAVLSAYVEVVFDNSDGRFPVGA